MQEDGLPEGIQQLCEKYDSIFKDELGKIHPYHASIKIDQQAKPKFCKAHSVPYSIRDSVGKELERLESDGIIEQVVHSEWATPIVVIPVDIGYVGILKLP